MNKQLKKLSLGRETVRRLTESELGTVAGGSGTMTIYQCCAFRESEGCPPTWDNGCTPQTHPSICHP